MNDPPSDVNENIIDIFILSVSEAVTSLFTEQLEKKGYRVTLFTDGRYLLETLREGKPNLLICDTATLDEEGFEVCRQIKADNDLWVIPVLILAKGSSLTDLLRVLDCNADNFITHPFDPAYGISVIDGLLSIPVERQTPEQIKTQFKISHNDQIYVVAANRRKLLEFLLSSFEITVNQSSELSRIKSELRMLSESAKNLEDRVREQSHVIDGIRETLHQKEQKILSLNHQVEEDTKILAQKTEVIEHFSEQLEDDKVLLTTLEKDLRASISQREEIESSLQSEISILRKQISELSTEVDQTRTCLDTVQGELDDEKIHCTSLECTLELQVQQKDLAEKTLYTLTSEYEQLKSALADEENRAVSAEQELQKVTEEKALAENDFTGKISLLSEEIQHHIADLNRIQGELKEETNTRTGLENTLDSLRKAKEQSESSLQSSISSLTQQLGNLQVHYDQTLATLESEQSTTASLTKNLAEVVAEKEKTTRTLASEKEELKSALETEHNRALSVEQELQKIMEEKTRVEQELSRSIETLTETVKQQTAELARLKTGLDEESEKRISAENLAGTVQQEKERTEQELSRSIETLTETVKQQTEELVRLKTGFEEESEKRVSAENLAGTVRQEKERTEQELSRSIETLTETVKQQTEELVRLKTGFEEESEKRVSAENLAGTIRQEKERTEQELSRSIETLTETVKQQTEELVRLKTGFEEESEKRVSAENLAGTVRQEKERTEQELSRSIETLTETVKQQTEELVRLKTGFEEESEKRVSAENLAGTIRQEKEQAESSLKSAIPALKEQITDLQEKYEQARKALETEENRTKSLKENLADIVAEKEKTEEMLKTDRDSYKSTFLRLKHDLDEATAIPATLEKELSTVKSQNKALSDEMNLAYQAKAQTSQQVHSLMQELEQVRAALASEKDLHRQRSESHDADKQNVGRLEQDLRAVSDERASLQETAKNEQRLRLEAEEKTRQAAQKQELLEQEISAIRAEQVHQNDERSLKVQNLEKEFELVAELQKSLEDQVNNLKTEKAQSEKTIETLTNELDQARAALAEEWEDHMISVAAAYKERQRLQQGIPPAESQGIPDEKGTAIIEQKPNLPVAVDAAPRAPVKISDNVILASPVPKEEPCSEEPVMSTSEVPPGVVADIVNIFSDEDLFETDEPVQTQKDQVPEPEDHTDTGPDLTCEEIPDEFSDSEGEDEETPSSQDEVADEDVDEPDVGLSEGGVAKPMSHGVFSFSRKQWFDLVKWARHSDKISHDQRMQLVRMGRLIQKDRKLSKKQEDQINEMIALVQALGYRPS